MRAPDASGAVLAVCGLAVEARLAGQSGVRTVVGGGRSEALAMAIEREVAAGVVAIISFGVAGALDAALQPGALVIATSIVGPDRTWPVDAAWARVLRTRLPHASTAPIAGSEVVVTDPATKRLLQVRRGAFAVDMESETAARIAAHHRLPFAALRAIADPVDRALPSAATVAMRPDGTVDLPAVLRAIARQPSQLPQLLRIGRDAQRALRGLGDGRRALGRGLGYLDLDQLLVDVV